MNSCLFIISEEVKATPRRQVNSSYSIHTALVVRRMIPPPPSLSPFTRRWCQDLVHRHPHHLYPQRHLWSEDFKSLCVSPDGPMSVWTHFWTQTSLFPPCPKLCFCTAWLMQHSAFPTVSGASHNLELFLAVKQSPEEVGSRKNCNYKATNHRPQTIDTPPSQWQL